MRRILVTGATGLIGRHLLPSLSSDHEVWTLARGESRKIAAGVSWLTHDLAAAELPANMPAPMDAVIHLAQSSRFREFPEQAADIFAVNVASTFRLLNWARTSGVKVFVYASSGGIYGHGDQEFTEDAEAGAQGPLGFYLASKHSAELLVESYATVFTVIILRFFFVYGPGQRPGMLIPRLVRSVMGGQPIALQGEDGIRINPVHVSDAVRAVTRCLDLSDSHKINVAGPEILTLRQIGDIIGRHVGNPPRFHIAESASPNHLVGDVQKMTRLLGAPYVRFTDGVADLCRDAVLDK